MKKMNGIGLATSVAAVAVAMMLAGCGDGGPSVSEAERFGYRGSDLFDPAAKVFLETSPGVTNWVPVRVLSVDEKYEFTEREQAVVKACGVILPGGMLDQLPEGYVKDSEEPWFSWWVKPTDGFGFAGRAGVLTHFDDERNQWETGLSYFSSYWASREEAEQALASIREQLTKDFAVLRFHEVENGWIAEYVRLFVMGVVGRKPDGAWACMINIRDKNHSGCGSWEPVADQEERRAQHEYEKAMRKWRLELRAAAERNHRLILDAAARQKLPGLTDAPEPTIASDGRMLVVQNGSTEVNAPEAERLARFQAIWAERVQTVVSALGVKPEGDPVEQLIEGQGVAKAQVFKSALYECRLDAFLPETPAVEEIDGQMKDETTATGSVVFWRLFVHDVLQPGVVMPAKPKPLE